MELRKEFVLVGEERWFDQMGRSLHLREHGVGGGAGRDCGDAGRPLGRALRGSGTRPDGAWLAKAASSGSEAARAWANQRGAGKVRRATSAPWKIGVEPQRIAPPAPRRSRRCGKRGKRARVGHERGGLGPAGAVGTRTLFPLFPQPDLLQPGRDLEGKEWRLTATVQPSPAGAPSDQIPTPESAAAHQHVRDDGSQRVTHVSGLLCYPCLVRTLPTEDDGADRGAIRAVTPWGKRPARAQIARFGAHAVVGIVRGASSTGC